MKIIDFSKLNSVILIAGYTDMRKGAEGLSQIVQYNFNCDPFSNTLYLFCGRRPSLIKALYWDGDGFILMSKRLKSGKFQWPRTKEEALLLSDQQIRWLFEGLSIYQKKAFIKSPAPKSTL